MIQVIAFDLFGTVLDPTNIPLEEKRDYIRQVRTLPWQPLNLPESWSDIPAYPDAKEGLQRLRTKFKIVTCSNWHKPLIETVLEKNGLEFDHIVALENYKVYKPKFVAYAAICDEMGVDPALTVMVTGNEGSPDLVYPPMMGMSVQRIRKEGHPLNITELANTLGC